MMRLRGLTCVAALLAIASGESLAGSDHHTRATLNVQANNGNKDSTRLPSVWPPPQEISPAGSRVSLNGRVNVVTGDATDEPTIKVVEDVVFAAGGIVTISSQPTGQGTQILIGTAKQNSVTYKAAEALTGGTADDVEPEGYVLGVGEYEQQPTVVLNGVDTRGTFYAAQTLRQLAHIHNGVPGVKVRDWPLMSVRGSIEGFYGIPWSHQARLDQYVLYGKHKMNTYIYTPKDDPLLRYEWRELYEGDDLVLLQELIETANANHVDFTFALSPGNDLCYSSEDDFNATITKFDQIRNLGVRRFYIALDDIPTDGFHCDEDEEKWPIDDDRHWLADAQTHYLNRVQEEYIQENELDDLETVPTNYAGSQPDPYKERFGTELNKKVRIQWTGEGVFSPNVTVESVVRAGKTYVTENLFFWDNFPVNDGDFSRLFLNPLTERDSQLYQHLLGFTSNPIQQPYASMISLINYGDYTWNSPAYDAAESMSEALRELAGNEKGVHEGLVAFVDLNQNWPYRTPKVFSPQLSKDMESFWDSLEVSSAGNDNSYGERPLRERLVLLTRLPNLLPEMAMKGFASDVEPWSTAAMQWARACQNLMSMLDAIADGDTEKADTEYEKALEWVKKTEKKTVETLDREGNPDAYAPNVGDGMFQYFLVNATEIYKGQ